MRKVKKMIMQVLRKEVSTKRRGKQSKSERDDHKLCTRRKELGKNRSPDVFAFCFCVSPICK